LCNKANHFKLIIIFRYHQLADMLIPTYSRLERGQANPSLGSMHRVATALAGVEMRDLLQPSEIKDRTLAEKLEYISSLSDSDRGVIEILIDTVIEKARLEKLQDVKLQKRLEELNAIRE
jgi:transcriptional regulator with XRE-family HTH domain